MDQENNSEGHSPKGGALTDPLPEASGRGIFPPTRWTLVLEMQRPEGSPGGLRALNELCQIYWHPVYVYVRTRGHPPADAEDLTQGFFAMLLSRKSLDFISPEKGRLRTFLLVALKRHLASEYQRGSARKRGGGHAPISLDIEGAEGRFPVEAATHTSPDVLFDRQWALTLLEHVMAQLKAHYEATGKAAVFNGLKSTISPEGGKRALAEIAAELGISEGAAKVAAHRLRQRYRRILEETIAETVGSEEAVREEIRHLLGAFGD